MRTAAQRLLLATPSPSLREMIPPVLPVFLPQTFSGATVFRQAPPSQRLSFPPRQFHPLSCVGDRTRWAPRPREKDPRWTDAHECGRGDATQQARGEARGGAPGRVGSGGRAGVHSAPLY